MFISKEIDVEIMEIITRYERDRETREYTDNISGYIVEFFSPDLKGRFEHYFRPDVWNGAVEGDMLKVEVGLDVGAEKRGDYAASSALKPVVKLVS